MIQIQMVTEEKEGLKVENFIRQIPILMDRTSEILERLDRMETILENFSGKKDVVEKIKTIVHDKKYITKKDLLSEVGKFAKNWRDWKLVKDELEKDGMFDVHPGVGKSETIIICLNSKESSLSMASTLFKSLTHKKDYNLDFISSFFNVDKSKSREILDTMFKTFKGRIVLGAGGLFKRIY